MKIRNGNLSIRALEIRYKPFNMSRNLRIIYVLKGEIVLEFVAGKTTVKEGQMEIINIDEPVAVADGSEGNLVLLFEFDGTLAKKNQPAIDKALYNCNTTLFYPCKTKNKFQDQMESMLLLIYNLFVYTEDNWLIMKTSYELENLIVDKFHDFKNMIEETGVSEANMSRFLRIYRSIYMNSAGKLNLKEIADKEYVSVQYLSKEFNEKLNINFKSTVEYYKVIQAVRYLISTNMSVTRVSENSGFSAPRYFYKQFFKYLKCTPAEFKAKIKSEDEFVWEYPIGGAKVEELVRRKMEDSTGADISGDNSQESIDFSLMHEQNKQKMIEEIYAEVCRLKNNQSEARFFFLTEDEISKLRKFLSLESLSPLSMVVSISSSRKTPSELAYVIQEAYTYVQAVIKLAANRGITGEYNWEISGMSESVDSILGYEPTTLIVGMIAFYPTAK